MPDSLGLPRFPAAAAIATATAIAAPAAVPPIGLCYDSHLVQWRLLVLFFSRVVNKLQWRSFQMLHIDSNVV